MTSPRHPTTIENLPGEVLSDIFIRLLAKQLAQMRCICKHWNALLSESSFVKSHLHRSIHHNNEILFFFCWPICYDSISFTTCPFPSLDLELTNIIKLPVDHQFKYICNVIGSVNGLICFNYISSLNYVVRICNPSLSTVLTLPPSSLCSHDLINICFRFGYDPKSDDYKVIKLTSLYETSRMVRQGEVYSMRKGSWEFISQRLSSHVTEIFNQYEVCVDGHDGHLHWLCATDFEWKLHTIVSFDLGAETFHEIPLPDSLLHHHGSRFHYIGILAGKLCVMSRGEGVKFEVWVMEEYGVAESWVKHHVFSQFSGDIFPYGFTSRNEFLFLHGDNFDLYDPIAAKTKTLKKISKPYFVSQIVEYLDSLVWIEPANHIQI